MTESKAALTASKVGFWPSPQDYNEAVQNPSASFSDSFLRVAEAEVDSLGLPRPISGGFASVYKLKVGDENWAVRFFLRYIPGQQERYAAISEFIKREALPCMVNFNYESCGVKVAGASFPLMTMEWVEGDTLEQYVMKHARDNAKMEAVSENFRGLMQQLHSRGMAHGDLQHGNIIVTADGSLKLVDYDGVYLPGLSDNPSNETGHANYQHPDRRHHPFDSSIDNFSALVIYCSLRAIAKAPQLIQHLNGCSDNLLFRARDFASPEASPAFQLLEHYSEPEISHLVKLIRCYAAMNPGEVPCLADLPQELPESLPELLSPAPSRFMLSRLDPSVDAQPSWLTEWSDTQERNDAGGPDFELPAIGIPAALMVQRTPRKVRYNGKLHQLSPHLKQSLIVLALVAVWLFTLMVLMVTGTAFLAPLGILLIPTAFAYSLSARVWKLPLKHRRLVRKGLPVRATVSEIGQIKRDEKQVLFNIYYSYTHGGRRYNDYMVVSQADQALLTESDEVTVLVDPDSPGESVIYDLSNYQACD